MLRPSAALEALYQLCQRDARYKLQAYIFVSEAMDYAQKVLGLGAVKPSELLPGPGEEEPAEEAEGEKKTGRHLTGQQLCEAIRLFALEQFGYLAKSVLNSWGLHATGDFGEIVYNLIDIHQMRKTKNDRREDFDDVFDFETGLRESFKFQVQGEE